MLENVLHICFEYYSSSWRRNWINFIIFTMRKENTYMLNSLVIMVHNKFFHELSQNTSYSTDNKWKLKLSEDNSLGSTAFVNEEHLYLHQTSGWICFPKFGESINSFLISILAKFSTTCIGSGIIIFQFLSTIVSMALLIHNFIWPPISDVRCELAYLSWLLEFGRVAQNAVAMLFKRWTESFSLIQLFPSFSLPSTFVTEI